MSLKLPDEVVLQISRLIGEDSSLDLKPSTLLNRQWHRVAAPLLLSTIVVSSLGKLVTLCDHIISFSKTAGGTLRSTIETHTKTLVIHGEIWKAGQQGSHLGLEDEDLADLLDEEEDDSAEPDIEMPSEEILSRMQSALHRLAALEGFEWYGRFAGDYYLVRYIQKANVVTYLAYGITDVSSMSRGEFYY